MEKVDRRTRRILCMTGNFHHNSNMNRLYLKRAEGGRGLKSFEQMFISIIVSLKKHIAQDRDKNHYLAMSLDPGFKFPNFLFFA